MTSASQAFAYVKPLINFTSQSKQLVLRLMKASAPLLKLGPPSIEQMSKLKRTTTVALRTSSNRVWPDNNP